MSGQAAAAFERLDWTRFDVSTLIGGRGIATIDLLSVHRCTEWLARNGYRPAAINCSRGVGEAVVQLGRLFRWNEQFGYELTPTSRSLDALRDGFGYEHEVGGGQILLLESFAVAWREDPRWARGLLKISAEFSLQQLALGKRFFTVLVVPDDATDVVGQPLEGLAVPLPYRGHFR